MTATTTPPGVEPIVTSLFDPITFRGVTSRNRISVSPMCQYSATDGIATDWHLIHLGSRAVGGAGIVIAEATAVVAEGRISPGDLGIWSDAHVGPLTRVAHAIRDNGAVAGIQLAHAGRKASASRPWDGGRQLAFEHGGWQTIAPSAIPFHHTDRIPTALDALGIATIVRQFAEAAQRAISAGFQLIEIHAAHGYLLHEFLSPLSNHRTDDYGGNFENRTRMLREVVEAVRAVMPDELPLFVRVSGTDWVEGGWSADDTVALAAVLAMLGVDLIDCSSGGLSRDQKIPDAPGYQVPFAARVRNEAGVPSGAVGRITRPEQAADIIERGEADIVLLARELLRDPYWPIHAANALRAPALWPPQYLRAET
jgi:2,4-dienoyl-CoA reductase-like NADH-dependent reductase (Old Yellow Enzyme family)